MIKISDGLTEAEDMKKRMVLVTMGMLVLLLVTGCNVGESVAENGTEANRSEKIETEIVGTEKEENSTDYFKMIDFGKEGYVLNTVDNDNVNNFGEWSHVTFETDLGHVIESGKICVEEWYQGSCVKSIPGIISPEADEIYIVMDVSMQGTTRIMIATDEYDGTWEVYYSFPFEAEFVADRQFMSWEEGNVTEITAGDEYVLSMVEFDTGNEAKEQAEYSLVVRAVFEEKKYELTEKAPGGEYPTNLFRLDEVVEIDDVTRKNAYIQALENILYKHAAPTEEELVEWTMGQNSYAIMDVNFDGKEELLIKHESVMADTKLCIYGYDEDMQAVQVLYCAYPEQTFYDNGIILAEESHNQSENEFWPYTLWMFNETTGIYEAIVSIDNTEKDAEVREQYIGDAKIMEILFEQLPCTMPNGAA